MTQVPTATIEQMREIDRIMIEFGVSVPQMMELAGYVTTRASIDLFKPRDALILAGKGNNGGDGLAAARHLHSLGVRVSVVLAGDIHKEVPLMQLESLKRIGIPIQDSVSGKPDLIIDSLLGFGSKGAPRGSIALLIREAQELKAPVLSVDIPSGFEPPTGTWFKPSFQGATVLTLGLPKPNMIGNPKIKRLLVGDIGIPQEAFRRVGLKVPPLFKNKQYIEA
jgi:NAD(P)H-hydrate epimerase